MNIKTGHGLIFLAVLAFGLNIFLTEQTNPGLIMSLFKDEFPSQFWIYGLQFGAIFIMHVYYKQRIREEIEARPETVDEILDKFNIDPNSNYRNALVKAASKRIMSCSNVLSILIMVWVAFYSFLCLKECGFLSNFSFLTENTTNSIIRTFNYIDSFCILLLSIFFIAKMDVGSLEITVLKYRRILMFFLIGLFVCESIIFIGDIEEPYTIWISISGAIVASLCFLSLFSRLESVFLKINTFLILILFLYGIFQSFYPLEMLNLNSIRDNEILGQFILYFGTFIKFSGKVILGFIIFSDHYRNRLIVYFCNIFSIINKSEFDSLKVD